jgi:RNase H-like domain found in reverse transcriptase
LAFLSGSFKNAASRWPIVEKEAFAIVETVCRMEYLLMRPGGFHLFTESSVNLQPLWP